MKKRCEDLEVAIDVEGVNVNGEDWGGLMAGHLRFAKGTDFAPVLEGLEGNLCGCPHWGYVMEGRIIVDYHDGTQEEVTAGEMYYWPPGHTVRFVEDTKYVEFSPADQMTHVLDHVKSKMGLG